MFAYNASKTALNAFTVHLAHQLQFTNIKVSSVQFGWVRIEMGGLDASIDKKQGAETNSQYALISDDGPTGKFLHFYEQPAW